MGVDVECGGEMKVVCQTCPQIQFAVDRFQGAFETKCPRCRQIHTYRYGSDGDATREVRCTNSFKGRQLGGWCGRLIGLISPDASGSLTYRCRSCGGRKTVRLSQPVLVST